MYNQPDLLTGNSKLDLALDRIKTFCPSGKKVLCCFSGGKDSQVIYHLLTLLDIPFTAVYSITRFEPPELLRFIREHYPRVVFRRAFKDSLVNEIAARGLPTRSLRWCCSAKHAAYDSSFDVALLGIRSAESPSRRDSWRVFGRHYKGLAYLCPIFDWSDNDVWSFLNAHSLPHCSLYDEGYKRIGCVCCPMSPTSMRREAQRWPKIANMLKLGLSKHFEYCRSRGGVTSRGSRYSVLDCGSPDVAFDRWLSIGYTLPPLASPPASAQPCLFAGTGFSDSDGLAAP